MISIVVPVYNKQKDLKRCVESLLHQSYADFEVVLVDDGSNDGSAALCDELAKTDSRINVVHTENRGVSNARNVGIAMIRGDYITFVDADDWVDTDFLQAFVSNQEDGIDMLMQNICQHYEGNEETLAIESGVYSDKNKIADIMLTFRSGCAVLFKADIIRNNNILFNDKLYWGEDFDFILRYASHVASLKVDSEARYHYDMPSETKDYGHRNQLHTCIYTYCSLLNLTSDESVLRKFRSTHLDWAIEELMYFPREQKDELPELLDGFARMYYPHLAESKRKTFRHRLFKVLCVSDNTKYIYNLSRFIVTIYESLNHLRK